MSEEERLILLIQKAVKNALGVNMQIAPAIVEIAPIISALMEQKEYAVMIEEMYKSIYSDAEDDTNIPEDILHKYTEKMYNYVSDSDDINATLVWIASSMAHEMAEELKGGDNG